MKKRIVVIVAVVLVCLLGLPALAFASPWQHHLTAAQGGLGSMVHQAMQHVSHAWNVAVSPSCSYIDVDGNGVCDHYGDGVCDHQAAGGHNSWHNHGSTSGHGGKGGRHCQ